MSARAPTTTLTGWQQFVQYDPAALDLLPEPDWAGLDAAGRASYDQARIRYHCELVVVETCAVRAVVRQGRLLSLLNHSALKTRRSHRVRITVTSLADGSIQRSRLAGDSIWVMTKLGQAAVRLDVDGWRVAGVEGRLCSRLLSQPCWRTAWKNTLSAPIRCLLMLFPPGWDIAD